MKAQRRAYSGGASYTEVVGNYIGPYLWGTGNSEEESERRNKVIKAVFARIPFLGVEELCLIICYGTGLQVWKRSDSSFVEIFSKRGEPVFDAVYLPPPQATPENDVLAPRRPLLAVVMKGDDPAQPMGGHQVKLLSLKTGTFRPFPKFPKPVVSLLANPKLFVVVFHDVMFGMNINTMKASPIEIYPCSTDVPTGISPVALGDRWLAYPTRRSMGELKRSESTTDGESGEEDWLQYGGGADVPQKPNTMDAVVDVAMDVSKGVGWGLYRLTEYSMQQTAAYWSKQWGAQ
eukprot:CAMPEP_0119147612 /NCGR_PEP_ID=MMETSP1310-20130426/40613_1 /TAXON_ID=464262 /ORGANISM="Genus nov. species nov., Strain RCC2339" /LENGTH=289 /DNA_ID=CAMNT_0007139593 /DNA_START=105 /DNA_END=971 /DNA_ORIENTATION=+